jgi:DNA mismatch endonuclease (patch repair protein)
MSFEASRSLDLTGWRRGVSVFSEPSVVQKSESKRSRPFTVKPDFVFPKLKLAVFVDGCFWHGCPRHFIQPRGNAAFWRKKIAANQARDRLVNRMLRRMGWKVLRVWEHELALKNMSRLLRRIRRMIAA